MLTPARSAPTPRTEPAPAVGRWLAAVALAVLVWHSVGPVLKPLGDAGRGVSWADLVDLLTPYAVLGSVAGALRAAGADRRSWALAGLGAVLYAQGQGVHLAANSIGNARGSAEPVHLWDEVLGHEVWQTGTFVVLLALARAVVRTRLTSPWRWPLALVLGFALWTEAVEGGTVVLSLVVAALATAWGVRARHGSGVVLVVVFGSLGAGLLAWGAYWGGFPQFSQLGWLGWV